jgi:hypothetical protein
VAEGGKGEERERIGQWQREERGKRGKELDSGRDRKVGRDGKNWTVGETGKLEERERIVQWVRQESRKRGKELYSGRDRKVGREGKNWQ